VVLTKKQQQVLEFIGLFLAEHGYSPSYREIMTGLELKSISSVAEHIDNLVAKGVLLKKAGSARSLEPVDLTTVELGDPKLKPDQNDLAELFRRKLAEYEARQPITAAEVELLKKAAELLGIGLAEDDQLAE
jgi:SOS-response transcriptional repressor LexA